MLEGVFLFVVLFVLSRKKPPYPKGTYLGVFLCLYGVCRFVVEFVRVPDAQLGYLLGTNWLTMGQILSIPLVIAGIVLVVYAQKKQPCSKAA